MKIKVDSPGLPVPITVLMVSLDAKQHLKKKKEARGVRKCDIATEREREWNGGGGGGHI